MKISEIKEKEISELKRVLGEKSEVARKSRFDAVSKQAKNTREIRNTKKCIARILTIIKEKKKNG